jgi:ribulose-phosphate 3-epimerase
VNPGFGGQQFIPYSLEKIRQLAARRAEEKLNFRIEVDGGIGLDNVAEVVRAGADIIVAGTSVFQTPSPQEAVTQLRQVAALAVAP